MVERLKEIGSRAGASPGRDRSAPQGLHAGQTSKRLRTACPRRMCHPQPHHELASSRAPRSRLRAKPACCASAHAAMVAAARPARRGRSARAAGSAMLQGGGDIDFLIIGSTRWRIRRCSSASRGLRAQAQTATSSSWSSPPLSRLYAQIGSRSGLGPPTEMCANSGRRSRSPVSQIISEISPQSDRQYPIAGSSLPEGVSRARPRSTASTSHGDAHVFAERTEAAMPQGLFAGMVTMAEPNPITRPGCSASSSAHLHRHADGPRCGQVSARAGDRLSGAGRGFMRLREIISYQHFNRRSGGRNACRGRVSPYVS